MYTRWVSGRVCASRVLVWATSVFLRGSLARWMTVSACLSTSAPPPVARSATCQVTPCPGRAEQGKQRAAQGAAGAGDDDHGVLLQNGSLKEGTGWPSIL